MTMTTERIDGQDVHVLPALVESSDGRMTPVKAYVTVRDGQLIDWPSGFKYADDGPRNVRGWGTMEEDCVALSWGAASRLVVQRSDVRWLLAPEPTYRSSSYSPNPAHHKDRYFKR